MSLGVADEGVGRKQVAWPRGRYAEEGRKRCVDDKNANTISILVHRWHPKSPPLLEFSSNNEWMEWTLGGEPEGESERGMSGIATFVRLQGLGLCRKCLHD
uniref:GMP synthase [glutamine-hydrolyzing] subunit A n=1 Tax=Lygus hesperus TaxID=30085 RepID=A0A0A9W341_LYGHE